jgi:hypothetical protein
LRDGELPPTGSQHGGEVDVGISVTARDGNVGIVAQAGSRPVIASPPWDQRVPLFGTAPDLASQQAVDLGAQGVQLPGGEVAGASQGHVHGLEDPAG